MERLTHETFYCQKDFCTHIECEVYEVCPAFERYNRLKDYEDTGYTPEDFGKLCREMSDIMIALRIHTYGQLRDSVLYPREALERVLLEMRDRNGDKQ